ncbi:hypothetical protein T484DRAFT_1989368, partial [Baffinella frigidus]
IPLGEELRGRGLRHAVCWLGAVSDEVALEFSQWFYRFLEAHPGKYREAFKAGKLQVEVLQKRRLYDGVRKPPGSVCLLSEAGDILPEREEEVWEEDDEEELAGEDPSGAPGGGGAAGHASGADDGGEIRSVNNAKGQAEMEAVKALGFPLLFKGYDVEAGIRLFEANKIQQVDLGKYGLSPIPLPGGNKPLLGLSPAAVKFLFADPNVASDARIKSYPCRELWCDAGPLVRRSEQVTPAQRNKTLEKLAKSIKLREDQAKKLNKNGGGNKGHDHMLDVLKVCPHHHPFTKPDMFCTRTETELTGFVPGTPLGSAAMGLSQMAVDEEAFPSLGGPATQRASKGESGRF